MSASGESDLIARNKRLLAELKEVCDCLRIEAGEPVGTRLRVNKRTHRIRFEGETEDEVVIVVEPKALP